jgi:hypothetical protein
VQALRALGDTLAFTLEMAMLAAFGYWGFRPEHGGWLRWTLGLGVPAVVIALWGVFLAPRSRRRLGAAGVAASSLTLFQLAALALWRAGQPALAVAFAIVAVVSVALSLALRR